MWVQPLRFTQAVCNVIGIEGLLRTLEGANFSTALLLNRREGCRSLPKRLRSGGDAAINTTCILRVASTPFFD
jgi:hypothetical protein